MEKDNKKSKILKLYKKEKIIKLLSVKFILPLTALFMLSTGITGIILAFIFKLYGLGGTFAGLGLSLGIASLTYVLMSGEKDSVIESMLKRNKNNMEEISKTSEFENQICQKIEVVKQDENNLLDTKKLINKLKEKLKLNQENLEEKNKISVLLEEEKTNLIKHKIKIIQQIKEIKEFEKQYVLINKKIKKLNPNLDVEYNGIL